MSVSWSALHKHVTSSLGHHCRCCQHNLEELALLDWLVVHDGLLLLNAHSYTQLSTLPFASLHQPRLFRT